MTTITMSAVSVSIKFSTNCESCGRMFTFKSNSVADLDASRWPKRCEECRVPAAVATPAKKRRRGKR